MMKINWKLRFQNKTVLTAMILQWIVIFYKVAELLGYTLPIEQTEVTAIVEAVIGLLAMVGIITDPTTDGISDSEQALGYEAPKVSDHE